MGTLALLPTGGPALASPANMGSDVEQPDNFDQLGNLAWQGLRVRKSDMDNHLTVGCLLCALVFMHGLLLLLELFGVKWFGHSFPYPKDWVLPSGPVAPIVTGMYAILALFDMLLSVAGAAGIRYRQPQAVGCLAGWLFLHLIIHTPMTCILFYFSVDSGWFGILLVALGTITLVAFQAALFYEACVLTRICSEEEESAAAAREELLLLEFKQEVLAARLSLATPGLVPRIFGCLPLEETVLIYTLLCGLMCLSGLLIYGFAGHGPGAWAFMVKVPKVSQTVWFEVVLYVVGVLFSVVGLLAIGKDQLSRGMARRFQKVGLAFLELDRAPKLLSTSMLRGFLVFTIMRIAFFIVLTGLTLIVADVCGAYRFGMANTSMELPLFSVAEPLHCTHKDFAVLLAVLGVMCLDGYLAWGTWSLYSLYRDDASVCSFKDIQPLGLEPQLTFDDCALLWEEINKRVHNPVMLSLAPLVQQMMDDPHALAETPQNMARMMNTPQMQEMVRESFGKLRFIQQTAESAAEGYGAVAY